jgi:hypothetical protein
MKEILITIPVMIFTGIFQATLFSRIHILNGTADIILLMIIAWSLHPHTKYSWLWLLSGSLIMTYLSAIPMYGYFITYTIIWILIQFLKSRFWQMPIILMVFVTIIGSIVSAAVSYFVLFINDIQPELQTTLTQIMIPSLTLNLLFCIPVYGILNDWANSLYYKEAQL